MIAGICYDKIITVLKEDELDLELIKITEQESEVLENLTSMYLHDMSEFADFVKLSPDGTYKYRNLNYYWEKEGLSAFFIRIDSEIAGFILSNRKPYVVDDCEISIEEFFILRRYRGKGYGRAAAREFFKLFPGKYHIAQLIDNKPAIEFWHSVYEGLGLQYEEKEERYAGICVLAQKFAI